MRLLPAAVLTLLPLLSAQSPQPIAWQTDLAAALQLAAERRAPLFVTFRCER